MSRLNQLPPDLSAVLSLLLRREQRYADVAALLAIQERAVHDRAHSALALLAPAQARALAPAQRELVGEYLLGQQSPAAQAQSRTLLEDSAPARAWAQSLASELAPLSPRPLALIPPASGHREAPSDTRETPSGHRKAPSGTREASSSSRVGGAVVLGGLAVVAIVAVLLIVGIGGGGGGSNAGKQPGVATTSADANTSTTGAAGTAGTSTTGTTEAPASTSGTTAGAAAPSHGKALTLTPPDTATSKAIGVAYVLSQKGQHAFYVFAKGLPALPSGSFYAVWLEGAATAAAYPLGSLPAAAADGLVEGGGPLPTDAASYRRIILTTETSHHPSHPGPTVLGGAFSLS
ncbi:MAG TPA: hypothetical protein VK756_03670 [Solirubrobacteraceae bacterium]|jgi:hypothetical protein|nr:hypothetical protein [Solirubrobacteraceae bacterium]